MISKVRFDLPKPVEGHPVELVEFNYARDETPRDGNPLSELMARPCPICNRRSSRAVFCKTKSAPGTA